MNICKNEGLEEPSETFTFAGPGAIQPAPVNTQLEKEFYEHPPWDLAVTPTQPAERPTAGAVSVRSVNVRVRGGSALVPLRCSAAGTCNGSLRLIASVGERRFLRRAGKRVPVERTRHPSIGSARFSLHAGVSDTARVRLTTTGRELLRRAGRRGLKVTLEAGAARTSGTLTAA